MYDIIIVGSGPAGLSAALNAQLFHKNLLWFGSKDLSNKVQLSEKIANYPGVAMVSGPTLNENFQRQIQDAGLSITEKKVTNIMPSGNGFMVLGDNDVYETKTVILATGVVAAKGFIGEDELLGKGVSYCATCDGFLYKDKVIAVYLDDLHYEHEVYYLAKLAKHVYWFTSLDIEVTEGNITKCNSSIKQIVGTTRVEAVSLSNGEEIAVDGVFILRNAVFPTKLLEGLKMDGAHIVVDRNMKTNIPGVFACGDCVGRPYQITKSVGEGNIAAHAAIEFLQ